MPTILRKLKAVVAGWQPVAAYRRRRDAAASLAVWSDGDERMGAFYRQFVGPGDLVLDVGANVGNRSKVFARLGCNVVAVEPQPTCADILRRYFATRPAAPGQTCSVEETAVGSAAGRVEMSVGNVDTVSSASPDWIDRMRAGDAFGEATRWERKITVPLTTLDALVARHGQPAFVKVDVEGFEVEVVKGLTRPVRALSYEFTSCYLEPAVAVLDRLASLGPIEANVAFGEEMAFPDAAWVDAGRMRDRLLGMANGSPCWGDVYVRSLA